MQLIKNETETIFMLLIENETKNETEANYVAD